MARIRAETETARAGGKARIIAKMNSLQEPQIIHALYEASQAGVKIDLIVRGFCLLRPAKGLSENIRVRSIIGRVLEHHRIFYFYAQGREDVYLSSADGWSAMCSNASNWHSRYRIEKSKTRDSRRPARLSE